MNTEDETRLKSQADAATSEANTLKLALKSATDELSRVKAESSERGDLLLEAQQQILDLRTQANDTAEELTHLKDATASMRAGKAPTEVPPSRPYSRSMPFEIKSGAVLGDRIMTPKSD